MAPGARQRTFAHQDEELAAEQDRTPSSEPLPAPPAPTRAAERREQGRAPVLPFAADRAPRDGEAYDNQQTRDLQAGLGNGALTAMDAAPATAAASPNQPAAASGAAPTPAGVASSAPTVRTPQAAAPGAVAAAPDAGAPDAIAAEPAAPAALDTSSADGLLQSLTTVPASQLGTALGGARAAAGTIQRQEKADLQAGFPAVPRPTGLPRADAAAAAPTQLPAGAAPEGVTPAGPASQPAAAATPAATGPVPGGAVSTTAVEPAAAENDDGGSWWDWLVNRVRRFLGQLPESDPGLSTSAGPRQTVSLTGDADPDLASRQQQASDRTVGTQRAQADSATAASFGENRIVPTVPDETLRPSYTPEPPPGAAASRAGAVSAAGMPGEVLASFDAGMGPLVAQKTGEQSALYGQQEAAYARATEETRAEGERRIAEENERTRADQQGLQQQARADVDAGRQRWRDENAGIQTDFGARSTARRTEADQQIATRVRTADADAAQQMDAAERRAQAERAETERRVAEAKRREESRPRSWWQRLKGAVSDAFAALKRWVTDAFDALRRKVKQIIDDVKQAVHRLIDAARDFVVATIRAFGEVIKGLVTIALAAFPEAAARARAWIDGKVNAAVEAVNAAAEALKAAADAILDWVGAALDAALAALQAALLFALDALEFLVMGFLQLLEWLKKLHDIVTNVGPIIQSIIDLINDPTPIIEAIKAFIGPMIAAVPELATGATRGAITFSDPPANHWEGIWSHLKPKLEYLAANWWTVIKTSFWHLLWPFAEDSPLWKDASDFWATCKLAYADFAAGRISKGIDDVLRVIQLANHIVGIFYGWVALGLIAGYAIAGGIAAVEVGVLPGIAAGAAAGAAMAGTVGMGLAVAALISEGAVLAKAGYNLIFQTQTEAENEEDYERIAGSGLTVAIIGALFAIGWLAKLVAGAVIKAVFGRVFRRPALRGRGTTSRGDIIELRVVQSARVMALLRGRVVTWLELLRRNFPVIDLAEDAVITITQRPGGLRPLYRVTGGRITSVKSSVRVGAALEADIQAHIRELAGFTSRQNVSVVNPASRRLVVALQTPVDAATEAALQSYAQARGVTLELTTALPSGHPAGVFVDAIPGILTEAGVTVADESAPPDENDEQPPP